MWSGWVGLGSLCGFGIVHPLPGIADGFRLNTAITLPVGVEAYGAYALGAWLTVTAVGVRRFAKWSAIGSLALGMAGQVIYHLLAAAHALRAPWPVVVLVSCLPVATLGMGAALTHLLRTADSPAEPETAPAPLHEPAPAPAEPSPRAEHDAAALPVVAVSRRGTRRDTRAAVARQRALHPERSTKDIARRLGVSERTVRRHTTHPEPAPATAAA